MCKRKVSKKKESFFIILETTDPNFIIEYKFLSVNYFAESIFYVYLQMLNK